MGPIQRPAESNSAIQQIENLRYTPVPAARQANTRPKDLPQHYERAMRVQ